MRRLIVFSVWYARFLRRRISWWRRFRGHPEFLGGQTGVFSAALNIWRNAAGYHQ